MSILSHARPYLAATATCCVLSLGMSATVASAASNKTTHTKAATLTKNASSTATPDASEDRVVTHKPSSLAEEASGQLDIIASVDAPMQSNILSWQDTGKQAPKSSIEFSALKDALMPTDRDRLSNEVRYSQILNQPEK